MRNGLSQLRKLANESDYTGVAIDMPLGVLDDLALAVDLVDLGGTAAKSMMHAVERVRPGAGAQVSPAPTGNGTSDGAASAAPVPTPEQDAKRSVEARLLQVKQLRTRKNLPWANSLATFFSKGSSCYYGGARAREKRGGAHARLTRGAAPGRRLPAVVRGGHGRAALVLFVPGAKAAGLAPPRRSGARGRGETVAPSPAPQVNRLHAPLMNQDQHGNTALHLAVIHGKSESYRYVRGVLHTRPCHALRSRLAPACARDLCTKFAHAAAAAAATPQR